MLEKLELAVRRYLMSGDQRDADLVLELLKQQGVKDLGSTVQIFNKIIPDVVYFDNAALNLLYFLESTLNRKEDPTDTANQ